MATSSGVPAIAQSLGAPSSLFQRGVEKMQETASVPADTSFASCAFTRAIEIKGQRFPQTIAHRGYRSKYPENTMTAFKAAVKVGAHALETDIHLTKDDVIVLSHDATLTRCFGRDDKIVDLDWAVIKTLKTKAEPHETMPRLSDLLEFLAQAEHDDIWVLLDIKLDNSSDKVMRLISRTLEDAPTAPGRPWHQRVVLGIWAAKYLPLAQKYMPSYPITHISFSPAYSRQFFKTPNVSFNMLCAILQARGGTKFINECHARNRPVYAWTVNQESKMDWCIRKDIDGVITDDPKLFLEVCEHYDPDKPVSASLWSMFETIRVWVFVFLFARPLMKKFDRPDAQIVQL